MTIQMLLTDDMTEAELAETAAEVRAAARRPAPVMLLSDDMTEAELAETAAHLRGL